MLDNDPCKAKPTATAHEAIIEPIPAVSIPTYPKNKINANTIYQHLFLTSANKSGEPECTTLDEIENACPFLDGMMEGNVVYSQGSTIVDCTNEEIKIFKCINPVKS